MAQIWSILENVLCVPEKNMDSAAVGGFLIVLVSHSFWGKVAVMLKGAQTALWRGVRTVRETGSHSHVSEWPTCELLPAPLKPLSGPQPRLTSFPGPNERL